LGLQERDHPSAARAVDAEISIERHHGAPIVQLGHPDEAGVGQRCRSVTILGLNPRDRTGFSSEVETDLQDPSSDEFNYYASELSGPPHEVIGFRQHRPASQQRWLQS
jgi:hypothetical protein